MKYKNLIFGLSAILVLVGATLKIMHNPIGNYLFLFGLVVGSAYQSWYIVQLEKKVKELESSQPENN